MATTNLTHSTIPEVNAYFTALEAAHEALAKAEREAAKATPLPASLYGTEYREASNKRQAAIDCAYETFTTMTNAARQFLRNSDNPLIAWVADNVSDTHQNEMHTFLRALPLTREQIEEFRYGQGWCNTYTDYLERAAENGVLPPFSAGQFDLSALREDLGDYFNDHTIGIVVGRLRKHLPQIVADYNTDVAKAQEQDSK